MNWYLIFKSTHIIGFVAWFAAIFYIVRLFVYHREALESKELQANEREVLCRQYNLMEARLFYIIQNPAMILTIIGGVGMLVIQPNWLEQAWMHLKLGLIGLLIMYHFSCQLHIKKLRNKQKGFGSFQYRLYNEVPTLLLIAVVFLAVGKNFLGLGWGLLVLTTLGVLMFAAALWYKRSRTKG